MNYFNVIEAALDGIEAHYLDSDERRRARGDFVASHLLEARPALSSLRSVVAAQQEAFEQILKHRGAPNVWNEGDGCQLRADGHDNCRPVIFDIARAALARSVGLVAEGET